MSDWYDNPTVTAERAVLTKDIKFTGPKDIKAEFLIPIFTPAQDNSSGDSRNTKSRAPSTKSQTSKKKLKPSKYTEANNITLTIPRYIVYEFYDPFMPVNYIPKGTEFIISGIGAEFKASKIKITGYYKLGEDKK